MLALCTAVGYAHRFHISDCSAPDSYVHHLYCPFTPQTHFTQLKQCLLHTTIVLFCSERSLYGYFSVLNDFAWNQYFGGFALFLGCVIFLSLEDSLGTLLAYDEEGSGGGGGGEGGEGGEEDRREDNDADDDEEEAHTLTSLFLFGLIDHDMLTCCKLPMTLTCGRYKLHFTRLLYYNLHGVLFTLAWCGMDSTMGKLWLLT